jgi:Uma2 family endonuclease
MTLTATWSHDDLHRFSVADYHRMIELGILGVDEPLELLCGSVFRQLGQGAGHDAAVEAVGSVLRRLLPPGWRVRFRSALTTQDSEPRPDLIVVCGEPRAYVCRHPGPHEIALVVEVAAASLDLARRNKARVYGGAGIAGYWIVNLVDRQLEVFTQPSGPDPQPAYRQVQTYSPQDKVPLVVDGQVVATLDVKDLFP